MTSNTRTANIEELNEEEEEEEEEQEEEEAENEPRRTANIEDFFDIIERYYGDHYTEAEGLENEFRRLENENFLRKNTCERSRMPELRKQKTPTIKAAQVEDLSHVIESIRAQNRRAMEERRRASEERRRTGQAQRLQFEPVQVFEFTTEEPAAETEQQRSERRRMERRAGFRAYIEQNMPEEERADFIADAERAGYI
jgi:fused signal recognition particle receptor